MPIVHLQLYRMELDYAASTICLKNANHKEYKIAHTDVHYKRLPCLSNVIYPF